MSVYGRAMRRFVKKSRTEREPVPKLLDGPFRSWLFGEIPVHDTACADVEYDEDVQLLKGRAVTTM